MCEGGCVREWRVRRDGEGVACAGVCVRTSVREWRVRSDVEGVIGCGVTGEGVACEE